MGDSPPKDNFISDIEEHPGQTQTPRVQLIQLNAMQKCKQNSDLKGSTLSEMEA
jgi:hypothetical protein